MLNRKMMTAMAAVTLGLMAASGASAQETVKIGLILPMTGQQASTGKQIKAAVDLYHATARQHRRRQEDRSDPSRFRRVPDNTKRIAQELIVNDKVNVIAGFGVTPAALADRAARDRSQGAGCRDGGRHLDHHRALALHRAHQLHAAAVVGDHRRLGRRRTASRRS